MIGDPFIGQGVHITLDHLFRRAALREPQRLALRGTSLSSGRPCLLSFAEMDRAVGALAARLRELGLPTNAVVAIQLPNTIEGVITLMGVLRAGMIAAPLPAFWPRREIVAALASIGAKAIIGTAANADTLMHAAAELFPVRYVCGFGDHLADGMVSLAAILAPGGATSEPPARTRYAADQIAAVTFDTTAHGLVGVARNHGELIAGGIEVMRAAQLAPNSTMLSTLVPGSFAAVALVIVPWLLTGGTLALQQPFDADDFAAQSRALGECHLLLPGPLLAPLAEAGLLGTGVKSIVALWRAPERLADVPDWHGEAPLTDVTAFGEVGLFAARRGGGAANTTIETGLSATGTMLLRGAMVSAQAFPPGAPQLATDADGFVDTGFPCRVEQDSVVITGPPAALVSGAYRSALDKLRGATVAAA